LQRECVFAGKKPRRMWEFTASGSRRRKRRESPGGAIHFPPPAGPEDPVHAEPRQKQDAITASLDLQAAKLRTTLECAVPLKIAEMQRSGGGPGPRDIEAARAFGYRLASEGDVLMFGSKKKGSVAELVNELVFALAVAAFQPGGCRFLGLHFEV
jgi:hypothetical protein